MKQLKFLSILMLVLMMMPAMVSCGDDNSDAVGGGPSGSELKSRAIGTWMCTQSNDTAMGYSYDGLMVGKQVTINSDGTYTSTASTFGYEGTYVVNGNKITAKSSKGDTFVVNVNINGNTMTWDGTASNGTTFHYVFIRE